MLNWTFADNCILSFLKMSIFLNKAPFWSSARVAQHTPKLSILAFRVLNEFAPHFLATDPWGYCLCNFLLVCALIATFFISYLNTLCQFRFEAFRGLKVLFKCVIKIVVINVVYCVHMSFERGGGEGRIVLIHRSFSRFIFSVIYAFQFEWPLDILTFVTKFIVKYLGNGEKSEGLIRLKTQIWRIIITNN